MKAHPKNQSRQFLNNSYDKKFIINCPIPKRTFQQDNLDLNTQKGHKVINTKEAKKTLMNLNENQ